MADAESSGSTSSPNGSALTDGGPTSVDGERSEARLEATLRALLELLPHLRQLYAKAR